MSILGAMFTAVSGINAQSKSLGHISDNIANSQTTGYKKVDTRFETLITVSNAKLHQPGGVIASPYFANGVQGNINQTQSLTNMAVSGNGFFVVSQATQQNGNQTFFDALPYYTRAGDFEVNRDGYLVNNGNFYLNGWAVDPVTGIPDTASLAPIQIIQTVDQPTPTSEIQFVGNLPASSEVNPNPPLGPTNIKVYDALGNPHTIGLVWTKRSDNLWKLDIQALDSSLDPVSGTITGVNDQTAIVANVTPNVAPVAQVDTVTLPSTGLPPGRTLSFTIGSNTVSITAPATGYTAVQSASALAAAINGNAGLAAVVTATNVVANTFQVTADVAGTPFAAALAGNGSGQVDTITVSPLAAGNSYTFTIGADTATITAPGGGWTAAQARDALVVAINANVNLAAQITAISNPTNTAQLFVQSDTALGTFAGVASGTVPADITSATAAAGSDVVTTANVAPVAQVDSITLGGTVGSGEIGDTYTITVGTQSISYVADGTETTQADLATRIAALVNASPGLGVTAAAAGNIVNLTAINAGIPYTTAATATNGTTPAFIDLQFGTTLATAGTIVAINNTFNLSGNAQAPVIQTAGQPATIDFIVDYGVGAQTITLDLGAFQTTQGITQYSGETIDVARLTQDGVPQGAFKDLNIRDNGDVELQYDNGRSRVYFRVPLAQFYDPSALKRQAGQSFTETFDSGSARVSSAGDNGSGQIRGSAVEGSNVDIAEEFSKMIVTQRAYAANTRVITTADEMLAEVINIKR